MLVFSSNFLTPAFYKNLTLCVKMKGRRTLLIILSHCVISFEPTSCKMCFFCTQNVFSSVDSGYFWRFPFGLVLKLFRRFHILTKIVNLLFDILWNIDSSPWLRKGASQINASKPDSYRNLVIGSFKMISLKGKSRVHIPLCEGVPLCENKNIRVCTV